MVSKENWLRLHTEVYSYEATADIASKKMEIDATLRRHWEALGESEIGLG